MKQVHSGIIALMTVLIIGAILLVITSGIALRSRISGNMTLDQQLSTTALSLATSCVEYALIKLSDNENYTGNESVTIGSQPCIIQPIETPEGAARTLKTSGAVNGFTRRLQVEIGNVNPPITITSWSEVDSF